jgi:hypothetical protein
MIPPCHVRRRDHTDSHHGNSVLPMHGHHSTSCLPCEGERQRAFTIVYVRAYLFCTCEGKHYTPVRESDNEHSPLSDLGDPRSLVFQECTSDAFNKVTTHRRSQSPTWSHSELSFHKRCASPFAVGWIAAKSGRSGLPYNQPCCRS